MGNGERQLGAERTDRARTGLSVWHWSTRDIPPRDRVASWHDVHARAIARRTISVFSEDFGDVDVLLARVGAPGQQIGLQRMRLTDASVATRERALLEDGSDDVILHVQLSGGRELVQRGRTACVRPGGAVFSFNAEPSTIRLPAGTDFVSIAFPHAAIAARVARVVDAVAHPVSSDDTSLRLLVGYLAAIDLRQENTDPGLGQLLASHLLDLAAHLAGSVLRDEAQGVLCGVRAARLQAIKTDIAVNLTERISARTLAMRHGVTARYVHKLFESEGLSVSNYILGLRLERVRRDLTDSRHLQRTIAELVYAAGFGDIASFNRAYRARFGITPSETRHGERGGTD